MSLGDTFRALRAESQARRGSNRERSAQQLQALNIPFVSKNTGAHLIVRDRVDFWPGTGKWKDRTLPTEGRGIRGLLRHLETFK